MSLNKVCASPTFKNLKPKKISSPVELKEKLRKDYKNKIQNCRNMLINRFRGAAEESNLRSTLTNIYNEIYNDSSVECLKSELLLDGEESRILEQIKQELIQEELIWYLEEYEKAQIDNTDWSSLQQDENVICLTCEKNNFNLSDDILSCTFCNIQIRTSKSLKDIKHTIFETLDNHSKLCTKTAQFSAVCELNESHIYLMCASCMEMQLII